MSASTRLEYFLQLVPRRFVAREGREVLRPRATYRALVGDRRLEVLLQRAGVERLRGRRRQPRTNERPSSFIHNAGIVTGGAL